MSNIRTELDVIPSEYVLEYTSKLDDVSSLKIEIPNVIKRGEVEIKYPLYDKVQGKQFIVVKKDGEPVERFVIDGVSESITKGVSTKTITANSYENTLKNKTCLINEGMTRQLYKPENETLDVADGILNIFEQQTGWTVEHVDEMARKEVVEEHVSVTLDVTRGISVHQKVTDDLVLVDRDITVPSEDNFALNFDISWLDLVITMTDGTEYEAGSIVHTFVDLPTGVKHLKATFTSDSKERYGITYELTLTDNSQYVSTHAFVNCRNLQLTVNGMKLTYITSTVEEKTVTKYRFLEHQSSYWYNYLKTTIQEAYGCYIFFDSYNKTISVYDKPTRGEWKGFYLDFDNLLTKITKTPKVEDITTRLWIESNNVDITEVNPLGTSYLEDYSYFRENGSMSQSLQNALDRYYAHVETIQVQWSAIKDEKNATDQLLVKRNSELISLNEQIRTKNAFLTAYIKGDNKANQERVANELIALEEQLATLTSAITELQAKSDLLLAQMQDLGRQMSKEFATDDTGKIFTRLDLDEIEDFTIEQTYTDDCHTKAKSLYAYAQELMKDKARLKYTFSLEHGDLVKGIKHPLGWQWFIELGAKVELNDKDIADADGFVTIYAYTYSPKNQTISSVDFNNNSAVVEAVSGLASIGKLVHQTASMTDYWKHTWVDAANATAVVEDIRKNGLDLAANIVRGGSTVNKVSMTEAGLFVIDANNEDNQIYIGASLIAITDDRWLHSKTAIDTGGVIADTLVGRLILGEQLFISNEDNSFSILPDGLVIRDRYGIERVSMGVGETKNPYLHLGNKNDKNYLLFNEDGSLDIKASSLKLTVGDIVTKEDVQNAVNEAIDERLTAGRNYALDTVQGVTVKGNGSSTQVFKLYQLSQDNTAFTGKNVAVSFNWEYEKSSATSTFYVRTGGAHNQKLTETITVSETETRGKISNVTQIIEGGNFDDVELVVSNLNGEITITLFKFEIGDKSTVWSAAPEDSEEAYTILLSNEAQVIAVDGNSMPLKDEVFETEVLIYQGSAQQTSFTIEVPSASDGITPSVNGNTVRFAVKASKRIESSNGRFNININVDGKKFRKVWTWAIAKQNTDGNISITGDQVFRYSNNFSGKPSPNVLTLTATKHGITEEGKWQYKNIDGVWVDWTANGAVVTSTTLTIKPNDANYADHNIKTLQVRYIVNTVFDEFTTYKVSDGSDGNSSYLHIRYSANADGHDMTYQPQADTKYIGTLTSPSPSPSDNYEDYAWSLIKGNDGIAGAKGEDGVSTYFHVKYSNDGETFTANNGEEVGTWIGTYVDYNEKDSMTFSDYDWVKFVGEDGIDGSNAEYVRITGEQVFKYSNNFQGDPTPSVITINSTVYNFTNPSYEWSFKRGGEDTWTVMGQELGESLTIAHNDGLIFNSSNVKTVTVRCKAYTAHDEAFDEMTITKISDGRNGTDGVSIIQIQEQYYLSTSQQSLMNGAWVDTAPNWVTGKYIWTRTKFTYSDGTVKTTSAICVTGKDGADGLNGGVSVTRVDVVYYQSDSPTKLTGGSWQTDAPAWTQGKYVWTKTITYLDNNTQYESDAVCLSGEKGQDGIDGTNGKDGVSNYFFIRYSAYPNGAEMTETPTANTKYMGTATSTINQAPTSAASYKWALVKGADGVDGQDGTPGVDGSSSYLHVKYSNDGVTFTENNGEELGTWIGTYVDTNPTDSTNFADYNWVRFVGEDGANAKYVVVTGDQTFRYEDNFKTLIEPQSITLSAIKYNITETGKWQYRASNGKWTDLGSTESQYVVTPETGTFANNGKSLSVRYIADTYYDIITIVKVSDGHNGTDGVDGIDGVNSYFYIRYSDNPTGSGMTELPNENSKYLGTCSTTSPVAPSSHTEYKWSLIKGTDGVDGTTIVNIREQYYLSTSQQTLINGEWLDSAPVWTSGKFIWTRTVFSYNNNTETTTDPICVTGKDGADGLNGGVSVSGVDVFYYQSTSPTQLTGGSWQTIAPTWTSGRYVWTKTVTYLDNGNSYESEPICVTGEKGQDGSDGIQGEKGEDGRTSYLHIKYSDDGKTFTSNNGETVGKWIGTYVDFNEKDSTNFNDYTWKKYVGEDGTDGVDGINGIDGTSSYFYVRYSANSNGNPMTTIPNANTKYIGVCSTTTSTAPSSYTDYTWSKFIGEDGYVGRDGIDGTSSYLHIKYSNDGGFSFTSNNGEDLGLYIGTYVDNIQADSNNVKDYKWSKFVGTDGRDGIDGINGEDGVSTYFYVRYSANANGSGMTSTPTSSSLYMGVCSTTSPTAPTNASSYQWSLIKGADGQDGTPGAKGEDGRTSYLHIKYSNDGGLTFTSNNGEDVGTWIGTYVDFTQADSNSTGSYTWKKFVGDDGVDGIDAYSVLLTNENHTFPADSTGNIATAITITTTAIGYKGATSMTPSIGTLPTVNGLTLSKSNNVVTIKANTGTNLASNGNFTIPVILDGKTFNKVFSWTKSNAGRDGRDGIDGVKGADGKSTYFYVRYSANANGSNMTTTPQSNTEYMGVCSTTSSTAPTSNTSYTWSKIKGQDGEDGTPGAKGEDGRTSYLHVKYSNDGLTFTGNGGEDLGSWIGTYVDFIERDSAVFSDYTWKKYVGEDGTDGADAYTVILTNEAHAFPTDSTGKVTSASSTTTTVVAYKGASTITPTIGTLPTVNGLSLSKSGTTITITANTGTSMAESGSINIPITVDGKSFTKVFSYSKARQGATGATGAGAKTADIIASGQVFKSTDGGLTFSPSTITLTPKLQNVTYSNWQYSVNGGSSWTNVTSGQNGVSIDSSSKALTVKKDSSVFTSSVTAIVFRLNTNDGSVYDTMTIVRLYDVTDLEIGTRNLLLDTALLQGSKHWSIGGKWSITNAEADKPSNKIAYFKNADSASTWQRFSTKVNLPVTPSDKLTFSFDVKVISDLAKLDERMVIIRFYDTDTTDDYSDAGSFSKIHLGRGDFSVINAKNTWYTVSKTFTVPTGAKRMCIGFQVYQDGEAKFRCLKLEKGNKATDWTPAPEDVNSNIDDVKNSLNSFQTTVNTTFKDGIVEEAEAKAIAQHLKTLDVEKSDIDKEYSTIYGNAYLTGIAKTNLSTAKSSYDSAHNSLKSTINTVIADGRVTTSESASVTSTFNTYNTQLGAYKQRVQEALDNITSAKVDNVEIGGRNLARKGSFSKYSTHPYTTVNDDTFVNDGGVIFSRTNVTNEGPAIDRYVVYEEGREYTISFKLKTNLGTVNSIHIYNGCSHTNSSVYIDDVRQGAFGQDVAFPSDNNYHTIRLHFKGGATDRGDASTINTRHTILQPMKGTASEYTMQVLGFKIEKGNKATDWSPAPEDMENAYTIILTNEAQVIPTDSSRKPTSSVTYSTDIQVYKGTTQRTDFTIGTINSANGITVGKTASRVNFTVSTGTALTADGGNFTIPITIDGKTFNKVFSWSCSKQGANGSDAQYVVLNGDQVFKYSNNFSGAPTPTTINIKATTHGVSNPVHKWEFKRGGEDTWNTITSATSNNYSNYNLDYNNSTIFNSSSVKTVTIRCTVNNKSDEITIAKISDGSNGTNGSNGKDAYTVLLTNESHTFVAQNNGNIASQVAVTSKVLAYKGTSTVSHSYGTITNPSGMTITTSGSTITFTVATGTSLANNGSVNIPIIVDGITFTKTFSWSKALQGAQGAQGNTGNAGKDAYTVILTNENHTFNADQSGNITSAISTTTNVVAYKGATSITPTIGTLPSVNGLTLSKNGTTITIQANTGTALASNGKFDIPITVDGKSFTKSFSWSKVNRGANAYGVSIGATSQIFKSMDGGKTYTPDNIVLTPILQNLSFSKWQYSTNGGSSFTDVSSGSNGLTVSSGKLTVAKTSSLFTDTVSSIVFKLITNNSSYYDTMTVVKINDVGELEIGGRNYVRDYKFKQPDVWKKNRPSEVVINNEEGYGALTASTANPWLYQVFPLETFSPNETVTIQYEIKCESVVQNTGSDSMLIRTQLTGYETETGTHVKDLCILGKHEGEAGNLTKWTKCTYTGKFAENFGTSKFIWLRLYARNFTGKIYFRNVKLEKGNVATDLSPAPEDGTDYTDKLIDELRTEDIAELIKQNQNSSNRIDEILSDAIITPNEKVDLQYEFERVKKMKEAAQDFYNAVNNPSMSALLSAMNTAYDSLNTALKPILSDMTTNSKASNSALKNNFKTFYECYEDLLTALQQSVAILSIKNSTTIEAMETKIAMTASTTEVMADKVNEMRSHLDFTREGFVEIYATTNGVKGRFSTQITDQKLAFKDNGTEVAYISNQELFITKATITDQMQIGSFIIKPSGTSVGGVIFVHKDNA